MGRWINNKNCGLKVIRAHGVGFYARYISQISLTRAINARRQEESETRSVAVIPEVHLILRYPDDLQQILLMRHRSGEYAGNYGLISGQLRPGETVGECAVRQAREKAHVIIGLNLLARFVHVMHRNVGDGRARLEFFFGLHSGAKWLRTPEITRPKEYDDMRWYPIYALPENTIPHISTALSRYRAGIVQSAYGWKEEVPTF